MVADEGIGIKVEDVKLLFKPFAKLKSGESFNPNGIGLGLSICKGILDKMGCEISVVSSTVQNKKTIGMNFHGTSIAFSMPVFFNNKESHEISSQ